MMKYSLRFKLHYNLIFFLIFISNAKDPKTETLNILPIGNVFTKYLNDISKEYELNFETKKKEKLLIFHFLPIECEINIQVKKSGEIIKNINMNNYNASYISFNDSKEHKIIINLLKDIKPNKNCPLIINYLEISKSNTLNLNIKENEPVFLHFNNNLKNINLFYKFVGKSNIENPIIVSFFIKEKIKFKIEISDDKNKIIERNITYQEYIIVKPNSSEVNYSISISLYSHESILNSTMIVKIIKDNSTPFYLQKNQLNLGFIPIEVDHYYYYMEVFKGEEGEIMLFNKRQNGILKGKIVEKNNNITNNNSLNVEEFPKYNENEDLQNNYIEFDIYNQKLSYYSYQTKNCEKGCFLLITYYSNISNTLGISGTEFSILSRYWDEEIFKSQIINIPLNEYIFGYFDENTVNVHYYSVFIPYETDDIYIEINGWNILAYSKKGIAQINTQKMIDKTKLLFEECQNKMIIKLNKNDIGLDSFKGEYISFAFEEDVNDIYSYYYFRILQKNPENDNIIYPLDSNKENFCETNNHKCYFLLKTEYNNLSNKILVSGFGKNNVSYKVSYINDITNLNLNLSEEFMEVESSNGLLNLDLDMNYNYTLVEITTNSTENENLTVLSNFNNEQNLTSINIYSYQLYHLSKNISQQFQLQNLSKEYRILINTTEGEGNIYFNKTCDSNNKFTRLEEHKIYSFSFSNIISFNISAIKNLTYNIKLIKEIPNEVMKELNYQYNFEIINSNEDNFPIIYFIKDVKYKGININFNFKYNVSNNTNNSCLNLSIIAYSLDYSKIALYRAKNEYKLFDFQKETEGKYDNITNSGTIELSNELLQTKYNNENNYVDDKYFMIIIKNNNPFEFETFRNDIYVFSKDKNMIVLPINKYIRNSFNLLENEIIIQKYFFEKENIYNNTFILEFSSNYNNKSIELIFSNLINHNNSKIIGGFKQYILFINSTDPKDYYFNVVIKPANELNKENSLKEVNIVIKYYNEENNIDYICNPDFKLEKISNTDKTIDYKLIINNKYENTNPIDNSNYICYLRLIKKNNILNNEELNTIAQISSKSLYIDKFNIIEPDKEFYFNLNNLKNNEDYIASIFIKIEKLDEEGEKYYSLIYHINQVEKDNNTLKIIISIIIVAFIIFFILLLIIYHKMKIKNNSLQDKVNAIDFSNGINEELNNNKELKKLNEDYENTFI